MWGGAEPINALECNTAEPIHGLECNTAEPTTLSVCNYLLILPVLDMFIWDRKLDRGEMIIIFVDNNDPAEQPISHLVQIYLIRLLNFRKVTQVLFTEYHSKRKHGSFGSQPCTTETGNSRTKRTYREYRKWLHRDHKNIKRGFNISYKAMQQMPEK